MTWLRMFSTCEVGVPVGAGLMGSISYWTASSLLRAIDYGINNIKAGEAFDQAG